MDLKTFQKCIETNSFPLEWPGHYINSKWENAKSSATVDCLSPNNGKVLCQINFNKTIIEPALIAAQSAAKKLKDMSYQDRIQIISYMHQALVEFKETIIHCLNIEAGKPKWEAELEVNSSLKYLKLICDKGLEIRESYLNSLKTSHGDSQYDLSPVGIAAAYLPFSTPFASFVHFFTGTVLAGCPLILISSHHSSLLGVFYSLLDKSLDAPSGSLSILFGNFKDFSNVIENKAIRAVLYTGSMEHCNKIMKESHRWGPKRLILKAGGKNSTLVHSSADIDFAAKAVLIGSLQSTGELGSATSRVFVYRSLLPEFKEKLLEQFSHLRIGPTDAHLHSNVEPSTIGPLYSAKAVERFLRYQTMAIREEEECWMMGKAIDKLAPGNFVSPGFHLYSSFNPDSPIQSNVLFCPDVSIYPYDVLDDAIRCINTSPNPFVTSFIGDASLIDGRRNQFISPNLLINIPSSQIELSPPQIVRFRNNEYRYHGLSLALELSFTQILKELTKEDESDLPYLQLW